LWDGDGAISFPMSNVCRRRVGAEPHRDRRERHDRRALGLDRPHQHDQPGAQRALPLARNRSRPYRTNPFNPVFLKATAPFSNLRFKDWGLIDHSTVANWADRPHVSDITYANGVPLEVMIDLANTLKVDPWFCIPHLATDDYVRQFAALLHTRLDPALRPHIEYSNEVWNFGYGQTTWAIAESRRLGLETPFGQPSLFYAQRATEIFKIVQQVYGGDSSRLLRVIAGQAVWTQFSENALAWKDTAANADVLAVAPYIDAGAADDPANVDATLALTSDQLVDRMFVAMRNGVKTSMLANASLAAKYRLKMKAYESGLSSTTSNFPPAKIDAMTALFTAANRSPRMRDLYLEYYGQWAASGGDTMLQFYDIGSWSKWGFWGALEYVTQDPATAPKYRGLTEFIASHP
jgi:hypothetical protein